MKWQEYSHVEGHMLRGWGQGREVEFLEGWNAGER